MSTERLMKIGEFARRIGMSRRWVAGNLHLFPEAKKYKQPNTITGYVWMFPESAVTRYLADAEFKEVGA